MNTSRNLLLITMPIPDLTDAGAQKYLVDTRSITNLPYGLLCLCTYVRKYATKDVNLRIIDINDHLVTEYHRDNLVKNAQDYYEDFVEAEVRKTHPDIVGISLMFNVGYKFLDRLLVKIRRAAPQSLIILGGNLATVLHEELALKENVDAVTFGEGEIPLLELVESDDLRGHLKTNRAFVTKESLKEGVPPVNKFLPDLNAIPPIDFRYVNLSNFNLPKIKGAVYNKKFDKGMVSRLLYTSRGCPYSCNFCAGFNVHGKKVRTLSIERIVNDVRSMVEDVGLTELFIFDDSFLFDKTRAKTILGEFVKLKINVNFPAILMRNIDDEIAELLSKLGNTFQYTSLESGSDYVLKHIIKKPISKDEAKRAVTSLRKFGISVLTNIVIGSPEETDEHRKETLDTLQDIGFSWVYFLIALPLPGSRLYKQCKEKGYLVDDNFYCPSLTKCNIRTPDYSPEHIEWQAYMMNLYTNFVHNYNMRVGNFQECITSFSNLLQAYPDHAFAYYFLAKAYEAVGKNELAGENMNKYHALIDKSPYWKDWAVYFGLQ